MIQHFLFSSIFIISVILIMAVFGRSKNKKYKVFLLIAGNSMAVVSGFIYPYHKDMGIAIPLLIVGILNLFAIRKIFEGENPNQEILNAWHDDPANWRAGVFYYNPKDKRILPPKRIEGMGWTVNFANPYSILAMSGILVLVLIITYMNASK